MKHIVMSIAAVALAGSMMAQSPQLSLGLDAGIPLGDDADFYSLTVGPAAGFEFPVGDKIGLTAQLAYHFALMKSEFDGLSLTLLPIQAGVKYYFTESQLGPYAHGQVGIHSSTAKVEVLGVSLTESQSDLSWAIGAGYQLEKLDIGLRYNVITNGDADLDVSNSSYIGIRLGFLLSLGG